MKATRALALTLAVLLPSACAATYTVKTGDTLASIAQATKMEPDALMRLNGLVSPTVQLGQVLRTSASTFAKPVAAPIAAKPATVAAPVAARGGAFINTAASRYLGIRYVLGGTGGGGLDCSGFTMRVFQQLGISLPRTAAAQWGRGFAVNRRDLRAGDLVFFNTTGRTASHVGIYLGNGSMANANSYQGRTVVEPLFSNPYWASRYIGARRVLS
ncbi:C40 family peptidase [Deinococcus petrolearius]|uniref:C40 family peptidase n=1 Tax=Deinococcus petrolearius TaxID=1751295 RepID=A0ABW1DJ05_9DEIO